MKRILIALSIFLIAGVCTASLVEMPRIANAWMSLPVAGGGSTVASGECTESYSQTGGTTALSAFNTTDKYYVGFEIDGAVSGNLCQVNFKLTKSAGDISGKTFNAVVYSMSGNSLDALQGTSDNVTGNNSWSATEVEFVFSTPVALQSGYAIAVTMNGADADNYANPVGQLTDGDSGWSHLKKWNQALSQNDDQATWDLYYKVYTQ